ncbi:MAG: AEC family transporter [Brevinema sp.]
MLLELYLHPLTIQFSSIILLILLGYQLRHSNFISKQNLDFFSNFCITIVLPCFIAVSFMTDLKTTDLANGINIIIWAAVVHFVFYIFSILLYKFQNIPLDDKILLSTILPTGNISFFGMAIATLLYQENGIFAANMYSIFNRLFINTIGLTALSGMTLTKKDIVKTFKSPALLVSLIGAFIFFTQDITPYITINNISKSILRIDHTIPLLYYLLDVIGSSLNMFVWIIIGASVSKESLGLVTQSKHAIKFAFYKTLVLPILGLLLYQFLHQCIGFTIGKEFLPIVLLFAGTPVANTLTIFSVKYQRAPNLCIACLITSTIAFLILLPIYYYWLNILFPV